MNKEGCELSLKRREYLPRTSPTRLTAWLGLRLLAGADLRDCLRDWRPSWHFFSRGLALAVAQNDFWDKRRGFGERELPAKAFGIWREEIEPGFTFASFYRVLVEWIDANYRGQERFICKKILASWQRRACRSEMEQATLNLKTVSFDEGWRVREETVRIATWGMASLACGREIPETDPQFLGITKLVLATQIVDDIVGLASDWKEGRVTFATLALKYCQNEKERDEIVRLIEEGKFIPSEFSQKAPETARFLKEKADGYLKGLGESGLKLRLTKAVVEALRECYPPLYTFVKGERDNRSPFRLFLSFFPETPD